MSTTANSTDSTGIASVCVRNAGHSQMATVFAEREREQRGLDDTGILTGGTHPADSVRNEVVELCVRRDSIPQSERHAK